MRKLLSRIFSKSYATNNISSELSNVIRPSVVTVRVTHNGRPVSPLPSTRSISISSNPAGTMPQVTPTLSPINVNLGPMISASIHPLPQLKVKPELEIYVPSERWRDTERSRRSYYSSLLDSSLNVVLSSNNNGITSESEKTELLKELNVKRVLSKNEEMKKVIFKVAATALQQLEESESLHPFITTAGEVFFGGSLGSLALGDGQIQDILTPGIFVLLFNSLLQDASGSIPEKQLFLAKSVVETSAGYLLHRTVQETNHLNEDMPEDCKLFERLHQGNKLATLTGDLLVVSLIKNVACTGNNKVLGLVMQSLSEFSTTEFAKRQPFQPSNKDSNHYIALLPQTLAESVVFSKGLQSCVLLHGQDDSSLLEWAGQLGQVSGLLWKINFDWMKLNGPVKNIHELNSYLSSLKNKADKLLEDNTNLNLGSKKSHHIQVVQVMRQLIHFWASAKHNLVQ